MCANDSEWVEEPRLVENSMMVLHSNPMPTLDTYSSSHYVDVDGEEDEIDVDYENADEDTTHLLDLSKK